MTNGLKKSDEAVRPVTAANKGARASLESPEERASTKGNPARQSTRQTQCRASVLQAAARIRKAAQRNPKERLTALFHHLTPEALGSAYLALKKDAAAGVDGLTWEKYGEGLDERLLDLHQRLHGGGAFRALPLRRLEIAKPDGGTRPLGIAALEDKIVRKAVVDVFLHYVLDLWFHRKWRPRVPDGEAIIVHFADDIAVGFQYKRDAERYLRDVGERLGHFGLGLHPDKTRLAQFGRFAVQNRRGRRQAGDLRLSGFHALLRDDPKWRLSA